MKWKLRRTNTPTDQERIKELEHRLDAAVAESRRMRAEMDELQKRNELQDLKKRLKKQAKVMDTDRTYPGNDTIN